MNRDGCGSKAAMIDESNQSNNLINCWSAPVTDRQAEEIKSGFRIQAGIVRDI